MTLRESGFIAAGTGSSMSLELCVIADSKAVCGIVMAAAIDSFDEWAAAGSIAGL